MPEKEGYALRGHLALDPAAAKRFDQVQQVLHDHILCQLIWVHIRIIDKQITQL